MVDLLLVRPNPKTTSCPGEYLAPNDRKEQANFLNPAVQLA